MDTVTTTSDVTITGRRCHVCHYAPAPSTEAPIAYAVPSQQSPDVFKGKTEPTTTRHEDDDNKNRNNIVKEEQRSTHPEAR